jgi:hypothetical protein
MASQQLRIPSDRAAQVLVMKAGGKVLDSLPAAQRDWGRALGRDPLEDDGAALGRAGTGEGVVTREGVLTDGWAAVEGAGVGRDWILDGAEGRTDGEGAIDGRVGGAER